MFSPQGAPGNRGFPGQDGLAGLKVSFNIQQLKAFLRNCFIISVERKESPLKEKKTWMLLEEAGRGQKENK